MTKFTTIIIVALTTSILAVGSASAITPYGGGFAAEMGGGGGGGAWPLGKGPSGQIASPGDAFYPNGAPQSREDACRDAGGQVVRVIEDGRAFLTCDL